MADEGHLNPDGGTGWGVRQPRPVTDVAWDAVPPPAPPPVAALVHAPMPGLETHFAPPPPPPPPSAPGRTAPAPTARPRRQPSAILAIAAGVVLVIGGVGAGIYVLTHPSPEKVVPLSTPPPSTVAVVHSGPAELTQESLTGSGSKATLQLPGAPGTMLLTPDRSRAFLLDTDHGDVIPVNLRTGQVGSPIAAGKLPVDMEMSADGSTLYVTDNLGGTVIPINTARGKAGAARPLTQGVSFYIPSPTSSAGLVGVATPAGQPGAVYFDSSTVGAGTPIAVGTNPVQSAFFSRDGGTVWIDEQGQNSAPGVLIPLDVTTEKPGTPIKLGIAPGPWSITPDGRLAVFGNQVDNTLTIVDLGTRAVVATVPVGATPTGVAIDASGTTAWVGCALQHTLVPVNLETHKVGTPVSVGNSPGDLAMPSDPGTAWVLYPSSNGSLNFLKPTTHPIGRTISVGNDPTLLLGPGSDSSWVANALNNTVQRISVAGESAGPPIPVFRAPTDLKLTPDGATLLVLSYGDGRHAGMLTSINTTTAKPRAPLSAGASPSDLTLSPNGSLAFVANYQTDSITVIDVAHWRAAGRIALRCGPTALAITPDGTKLFAACRDSAQVVPVGVASRRPGAAIKVTDNPRLLVMPALGTSLLIVGSNGLQSLDIASNAIVRSQPETGNLVSAVESTDGGMILAVDNSGAALLLINPETLAIQKSLAVGTRPGEVVLAPDGAHAYVLDTSEQRLYVVNVRAWTVGAAMSVAPNASAVVVPEPVVVPSS